MLLSTLFPSFQLDEATTEAWRLVFRDENPNDLARAITVMARDGGQDFTPTASDVAKCLKKIKPSKPQNIHKAGSSFFEGELRRRAAMGQVPVVEDLYDGSTAKTVEWVRENEARRVLDTYVRIRGVEVEKWERLISKT